MSLTIDRASLLVRVPGAVTIAQLEETLAAEDLTLGIDVADPTMSIAEWIAKGAPGAPSPFDDPADHLLAGLSATLHGGQHLEIRPGPRRAVGPDLVALVFGAAERFATLDRAWLRVRPRGKATPQSTVTTKLLVDSPVSREEAALLDAIARELRQL